MTRYPMLCESMTRRELLTMYLTFQELGNFIRERNEGPRSVDAMSLRRLGKEFGRRVAKRLLGR
jgi:hypothetical protein